MASEEPRSTAARPLWSETSLREHLRFFNGSDVNGRATGTAGYAAAGAYVAARMAESGLQPGLGRDARVVYLTPLNEIRSASLSHIDVDSLLFYPGIDYLPDGRSDSGTVDIYRLGLHPEGTGSIEPEEAILIPASQARTSDLEHLREAGAQVVFVVGPLSPQLAAFPVAGLVVVQLPVRTVARLLHVRLATLREHLRTPKRTIHTLAQPLRLRVETRAMASAGALNILAYVPGKHPARADELVIVCADLDNIASIAGVPTLDTGHLGVGTATVLELARQYGQFARYGGVPERTLLFAVFSGARQGHKGLRNYLHRPLWALDKTHTVVYVGLDPDDEPEVRTLLNEHNLSLHVVAMPTDSVNTVRVFVLPEQRPPRQSTVRSEDGNEERADLPRVSALLEAGVSTAMRMAEEVHTLLLREAITPASFIPVNSDTLRIPDAN